MATGNSADLNLELPHKLVLEGRKKLSISGVREVESFDDTAVVLQTNKGTMIIRGEGLHLQMLSLDGGQVSVDGLVDSIQYENDVQSAGSFFSRLFR
jgi:sporulation protein YabP